MKVLDVEDEQGLREGLELGLALPSTGRGGTVEAGSRVGAQPEGAPHEARSPIVNLSNDAAGLIRSLVSDSDLPESAGLRLGTDDDTHALAMNLVTEPGQDDLVVEHQAASLFVSPLAASRLQDQTLQAQVEPRPAFFVDSPVRSRRRPP